MMNWIIGIFILIISITGLYTAIKNTKSKKNNSQQ